ncbi:purine catabolism regulatory protein [Klenkia soli]|uniref:Purine catabolism regulatory protein n=1 Tax=Klenkia soli TaxID=1052260 RepID=A0A1H0GML5_9ACTN|nr:PucR family transcriptional regulator [Klenkia soli]SDO08145.1 purine catabolism regulatory protein [Klenkia soli]
MSAVTVSQVLAMEPLRGAGPTVLAGAAGLGAAVRWVHTTELVDIASLLRGGDLVLSTGIALPDDAAGLSSFARSLHASEATGLVIELGRRWSRVPDALVVACEELDLPLVALDREVRFAAVAQAVGERIVDEQVDELRSAQRVHDVFTQLGMAEAGPAQILEATARLAGATVVQEDDRHGVVDYRPGPDGASAFLADWTVRSRTAVLDDRTGWDAARGWLVTRIGRPERGWGRLVLHCPEAPSQRATAIVERAAAALALHRLHDRHRDGPVRRAHSELLLGLLADPTSPELLERCQVAGLPVAKRQFVGLAVRPATAPDGTRPDTDEVLAAVVHSVHEARVPALVAAVDRDVRVLLSLAVGSDAERATDDLARRVQRRQRAVVGAGRVATRVGELDRTLHESRHVLDSVPAGAAGEHVLRLADVHLRGLLAMLADDDRVRMFVRRELTALREHDEREGDGLVDVVRALVLHPRSRSDAAASLHLSRATFYDRLAKVQRVLHADLDDPDVRVSLHVALLAEEIASTRAH